MEPRQAAALGQLRSPWCSGMVVVHFCSYHEFSVQAKPTHAHERRKGKREISREDEAESEFDSVLPRAKLTTNTNNGCNNV